MHSFVPRARRASVWGARALFVIETVAIAGLTACDDPFQPRATSEVRTDTFSVYAMNGTPVNVPAAFNVVFFTPVRIDPSYAFDIAFDIDGAGNAVLYPVRLIGGAVTAGRQDGLQKSSVAFDQLAKAARDSFDSSAIKALSLARSI